MKHGRWNFLTGDTENDRRNVSILLESLEQLYGPQPLEDLLRNAVDRAFEVTGAERGILLREAEGGALVPCVARDATGLDLALDERHSSTVVRRVWSSGEAFLTMDAADQPSASLSESMVALRLLSVMAVPMPVKGRNLGVLYVDSTFRVKEFTQSDFSVFQALGGLVALALENARLLQEKGEQERIKRELLVAQQIQLRLLPRSLPQPAGYEFAGVNRPCEETSGDYYDALPYGDARLALMIGDVSGHGLGPALIMASTRALLHSNLSLQSDPVDVMSSVNRFLERDIPENAFMSFFLGSLDPATRSLTYVSAGHNPPLLRRANGTIEELTKTGPVLGVLADATFRLAPTRTLEAGDVLLLYTDGIYEAHDSAGQMYGEERLHASFGRRAQETRSAQALLDGLLSDLMQFVGDQPLDDDVTCLIVRLV